MRPIPSLPIALFIFPLLALFSSCASPPDRKPAPEAGPEAGPGETAIDEQRRRAQRLIAAGEYEKALDLYAKLLAQDGQNEALRKDYGRAGETIKAAADRAYKRTDFAAAGGIYRVLLDSGITGRSLPGLSFTKGRLNNRIKSCADALIEAGLLKYRQEQLDQALVIWTQVLAFDPENKHAKKAYAVTNRQVEQLKKMR